jgi:23S rRNA (uracil1939-C5)-methyltransferase
VAEQLVIDHVGHRGDGVARADGHSVYVPYTLGEGLEEDTPNRPASQVLAVLRSDE